MVSVTYHFSSVDAIWCHELHIYWNTDSSKTYGLLRISHVLITEVLYNEWLLNRKSISKNIFYPQTELIRGSDADTCTGVDSVSIWRFTILLVVMRLSCDSLTATMGFPLLVRHISIFSTCYKTIPIWTHWAHAMMTSSNDNFPSYWPFVRGSHRWIPRAKASYAELWGFL